MFTFYIIQLHIYSIDPIYLKSTGTPVNNGLLLDDIDYIIDSLKGNIISSDIVECNPYLTDETVTEKESCYINNYIHRLL